MAGAEAGERKERGTKTGKEQIIQPHVSRLLRLSLPHHHLFQYLLFQDVLKSGLFSSLVSKDPSSIRCLSSSFGDKKTVHTLRFNSKRFIIALEGAHLPFFSSQLKTV